MTQWSCPGDGEENQGGWDHGPTAANDSGPSALQNDPTKVIASVNVGCE